jgi:RNA methyltransferase, TrmH family
MLTHNEIKFINALQRKKERIENGLFVVEGVKMIDELLQTDYEIEALYSISDTFLQHSFSKKINKSQLDRISNFSKANEALALVKIPKEKNPNLQKTSIILEEINDPGNLGTIIRTANWFGIDQIICSPNSVDCYNPKVVSATMGAIFRTEIFYTDIATFISESTIPSYGALLEGEKLPQTNFQKPCHLIFGSESHGLSKKIIDLLDYKVTIPGSGASESLNLGIAVGIFCNHYFNI